MQENRTVVTEFILLGFQGSQSLRYIQFFVFLVVYCGTICGNLLIITLVSTSRSLHTPMYFFISQLSTCDILLTSDIVPNMLYLLLNNGGTISFGGCMTQFYFFCASEGFECLLLAVMSYDRYVAICYLLHYHSMMTTARCVILTLTCWLFGFIAAFIDNIMTQMLDFCGPNIIEQFFCDLDPLLKTACSDTYIVKLYISLQGIPAVIIPTTIIITTYGRIATIILKIPSNTGRQKAFSTCSSHLVVVSIFYWSLFSAYVVLTGGQSFIIILSLLYTVLTPLVNPIIYSLRNTDIKKAVQEFLKNMSCLSIFRQTHFP